MSVYVITCLVHDANSVVNIVIQADSDEEFIDKIIDNYSKREIKSLFEYAMKNVDGGLKWYLEDRDNLPEDWKNQIKTSKGRKKLAIKHKVGMMTWLRAEYENYMVTITQNDMI